jgi:hypothetical protein
VSQRSVYTYLKKEKLSGLWIGEQIFIDKTSIANFVRTGCGRQTNRLLPWRRSRGADQEFMAVVEIRSLPGQSGPFEEKLASIYKEQSHLFPGTVGRSLGRCLSNPECYQVILVWKMKGIPSEEKRQEAITAFLQEFEMFLDLDTATMVEFLTLFSAS